MTSYKVCFLILPYNGDAIDYRATLIFAWCSRLILYAIEHPQASNLWQMYQNLLWNKPARLKSDLLTLLLSICGKCIGAVITSVDAFPTCPDLLVSGTGDQLFYFWPLIYIYIFQIYKNINEYIFQIHYLIFWYIIIYHHINFWLWENKI